MLGVRRPPATVRALIGPDERALAWAAVDPGRPLDAAQPGAGHIVATNVGLWWPEPAPRLIPWFLVVKASWSEAGLSVVEAEIDDDLLLIEQPVLRAPPTHPGRLPPVIKQRVEASVARTHEVSVSGGTARVVGRRVAGRDGLSWWARLSSGTPDTRAVRLQLTDIVDRLRAEEDARRAAL